MQTLSPYIGNSDPFLERPRVDRGAFVSESRRTMRRVSQKLGSEASAPGRVKTLDLHALPAAANNNQPDNLVAFLDDVDCRVAARHPVTPR